MDSSFFVVFFPFTNVAQTWSKGEIGDFIGEGFLEAKAEAINGISMQLNKFFKAFMPI